MKAELRNEREAHAVVLDSLLLAPRGGWVPDFAPTVPLGLERPRPPRSALPPRHRRAGRVGRLLCVGLAAALVFEGGMRLFHLLTQGSAL